MSRTYRRRGERHEYRWVSRDWILVGLHAVPVEIHRHSREGRRAITRFHSDAEEIMRSAAPHWYRREFDHRIRTMNNREDRRWLADPGYDPVMHARHRHSANRSWW